MPSSIRFEPDVSRRLASYVARHPGWTRSSTAARLVDEGLRMEEHPGVVFRDGPTGRRATLIGGPDVWEVVRAVRSARAGEPDLSTVELLEVLETNTGASHRLVHLALAYWAAYPAEVDAMVEHADHAEDAMVQAATMTTTLLRG